MSRSPKKDWYCILCDWKLKDSHKHLDGIKCPYCHGPVIDGERK